MSEYSKKTEILEGSAENEKLENISMDDILENIKKCKESKEYKKALEYYRIAIDKGNKEIVVEYVDYLEKLKLNIYQKDTLEYYKVAADAGNKIAINKCIKIGNNCGLYEEAGKYCKIAADTGNINASFEFAKMLKDGRLKKNLNEAEKYCKIAADNNNSKAIEEYIKILKEEGKILEAIKYFKEKLPIINSSLIKSLIYTYGEMLYKIDNNVILDNNELLNFYKKELEETKNNENFSSSIEILKEKIIKKELETNYGYKIGKLIGVGGEGKVFSANDELGNEIVIKIPKIKKSKFLTEEKIKNKEKIDNYIDIIGNGYTKVLNKHIIEIDNDKYLVEIYKKREISFYEKLEDMIFNKNNNEYFPLMSVMAQLILALEAAHLKGLILADIKPENILINKNKRLKFSDFGLSDFAKNFKENLKSCGTWVYMANELFSINKQNGNYMSEKSDVYSLGIIFYEILTQKSVGDILKGINKSINFTDCNSIYKSKENLSEKITIDDINLKRFFPNKNFSDKEQEIKEKILGILKIMLKDKPKERATIFEVKEKFIELINYMSENLTKDNNENISIEKDLGIENKELHKLGLSKEVKIEKIKTKFVEKLDFLIGNKEPNKEELQHNTLLLKGKELSSEAKKYLKIIRDSINESDNSLKSINYEEFKNKLEILNKPESIREYIFLSDKLLELEKIRDIKAGNNLENFDKKSLISVIDANPEMVEYLFVLNLSEEENLELKIDIENKTKEDLKAKWLQTLFNHSCENKDIFAIKLILNNKNFKEIVGKELIKKI